MTTGESPGGTGRGVSVMRFGMACALLVVLGCGQAWAKSKKKADAAPATEEVTADTAAATPSAETPAAQDVPAAGKSVDASAQGAGDTSADVESPTGAEGEAGAPSLDTLQNIMAKVWRDNPEVVQAERAVEASGYDITTARVGYLPYAQVQTSQARKTSDSSATVYVVLPLWNGGLTNAQISIAKAKQRAALAELARTRWDVGQRTLEAYFNVAQAQDQLIQWSNYAGALKKLQDTIQRRAAQGVAPQADVETAVSRVRQADASREATRANLLTNRAQLMSLLNTMPGSLAWPEDSFLLSDEEIGKAKDNVEKHPSYLAARAEIDVQKGTARSALASLSPTFSLQYHKQLEGVQFDPTNNATLLVAQLQTGNGLQGVLGYRAEKQRVIALEAKLDAVDRQVAATIDVDRTQLMALRRQLHVQFEAAQAANKLIDSFIRQFEAGRKTWLDVLNAQREANDLMIQSVLLRRNYWYANAKLALDSMNWNRLGVEIVGDTGEEIAK